MGMVIVAVIYGFMNMKAENPFRNKITWLQIISGFFFAFGALTYLISAQPNMNGFSNWIYSFSNIRCACYINWYLFLKTT